MSGYKNNNSEQYLGICWDELLGDLDARDDLIPDILLLLLLMMIIRIRIWDIISELGLTQYYNSEWYPRVCWDQLLGDLDARDYLDSGITTSSTITSIATTDAYD